MLLIETSRGIRNDCFALANANELQTAAAAADGCDQTENDTFFLSRCSIGEIIGGERLQKRAWIKSPHHKGTLSMLRHRKLNSHFMFWGQNEVFAAVSSLIQMNAIIYGKTGGYSRRGSGPCSTLALGIKLALAE